MQSGDYRLRTIDDVEHEVARLWQNPRAHREVMGDSIDKIEASTGGEPAPGSGDQRDSRVGIAIDGEPDIREFRVCLGPDRVEIRGVEHDLEHTTRGVFESEMGVRRVTVLHGPLS